MDTAEHQKNLFEVNNARSQTRDEVVQTFVPSSTFFKLLSGKNHIVLGSRGSGKTALLRMMSHDHLAQLRTPVAQKIIADRSFIGIYLPMRAEWVSTLKNKPETEAENELAFQWRLNLSCCRALLDTVSSCLLSYVPDEVDRIRKERAWCKDVSRNWFGSEVPTISELKNSLEDLEWERQVYTVTKATQIATDLAIAPGPQFDLELFSPLRRGIQLLGRQLDFPEQTRWLVCLDEIEFLDERHHRILNSHLRAASAPLCFKFSTMPYFHHTLETNSRAPLVHAQDFDYSNLDNDRTIKGENISDWEAWATKVLDKRFEFLKWKTEGFSFEHYFGERTPLLDSKPAEWSHDSSMMRLLRANTTFSVQARASRLTGTQFKDQISRKLHGMLLLRETVKEATGHQEHDLYSGPKMIVRCSDANPRQLIRLFNELTTRFEAKPGRTQRSNSPVPMLNAKQQTQILINYSNEVLSFVACEEEVGGQLAALLKRIGNYFRVRLHQELLSTDYYYAVKVESDVDDKTWALIEYAVGLGLMLHKRGFKHATQLPYKSGEFHLAFRLAPAFSLLPQRGKAVPLKEILEWRPKGLQLRLGA